MRRRRTGGFYTHELVLKPGGSRSHEQAREHGGTRDLRRHSALEIFSFEPYVGGVHLDELASLPLHEIKRRFDSEFDRSTEKGGTASTHASARGIHPGEAQADRLGTRIAEDLPATQSLGTGPLPRPVQEVAERRLGVAFSGVELRADEQGESKALSHGAFALAEGSNIHFARGQASLASERGRELLGHELAHVAQTRVGVAPAAAAQARSFPRIHEQVLQALIRAKSDDPSFSSVKGLLAGRDKDDAEGLFQRLTSGSKKDDFAVFFNSDANVPAEVREELLAILRSRFGGAAAGATEQGGAPKTTTATEEPAGLQGTATGRASASIPAAGLRDPDYVERRAVRVGIPLPGGPYRLDLTKQQGGPAIAVPRKDVHLWVDPFFGRTEIFIGPDLFATEAQARQAAAQFKDVPDATAFALYRGPHGVILPTIISETTAPHLIHVLRLLQQEEIASGQAVSDLAVELLLLRGAAGGVRALRGTRGTRVSEKTTKAASQLVSKAWFPEQRAPEQTS